jgi:hypothetical protein
MKFMIGVRKVARHTYKTPRMETMKRSGTPNEAVERWLTVQEIFLRDSRSSKRPS